MHSYKRWVIFTASLFLAISAALVNGAHLYYMSAVLLMLPVVSYLLGMTAMRGLEFSREVPATGWAGETATFHVVVRSRSPIPRLFLRAWDDLPEWLVPIDPEPPLFNAAPNAVSRAPYQVHLAKRGAYRLESMVVTALDPLGIFAFSRRFRAESEVLVFPVPQPISDIPLTGAERYGLRDTPVAAVRGSGVDPDGVREYVPGDPLRRMHWKSTARTGRLNVIEFDESRSVNVVLALDQHAGSCCGQGAETTFEHLVRAAASLAQAAIRQGASVRLATSLTEDASSFLGRGTDQLYAILGGLARVEPEDRERMSATLIERVGPVAAGTSLIVLTSGLDLDLPGALARYAGEGSQVAVVYADPHAFPGARSLPSRDAQRTFMQGLIAVKAIPFTLSRTESGELQPEPVYDVSSWH